MRLYYFRIAVLPGSTIGLYLFTFGTDKSQESDNKTDILN
jgi:hypothetical protein